MLRITYHKDAVKTLAKMPRGIAERIRRQLQLIAQNPGEYAGDWKQLRGTPFWRLRVGGWRAVCEVHDEELVLLVLKIGTRGDVYK